MNLKPYQQQALKTLGDFLNKAQEVDPAEAFEWALDQEPIEDQPRLRDRLGRFAKPYKALPELGDTPYACIRLPTGGGKTILAAHAVPLARDAGLSREYPVILWLVTSNIIREQTAQALSDPRHPYRAAIDAAFGQRVRVFDISDFANVTPQDLAEYCCIIVGTVQTLRVENTEGRKVYAHHEALEPHFSRFDRAALNAVPGLQRTDAGGVRYSFANLLHLARPMLIIDEAHNVMTGLSDEMRARINPFAIVEFTATPKGRSNILFNATAAELKAEQMIKLPIVLQEHAHWHSAVAGAVTERARLAALAAKEKEHLRPIALYQAEPKNREVTVEVLYNHLRSLGVAEDQVVIATGDQRGLDGVDLSAPGCRIEHIITVEALKEGWDCPFAYVFCSVASLKSSTAVEQLLGRVLRMPYAQRRQSADLNRAYAHVSEPTFYAAATALRDALVDKMGFEDGEAEQVIEHPQLELTHGLFAPPEPPLTLDVIDTPEVRQALSEQGIVPVESGRGVLTLSRQQFTRPGVIETIMTASPAGAAALKAAMDALPLAPATKGAVMRVPKIGTTINGELVLADLELIMEHVDWRLSDQSAEVPGLAASMEETIRRFFIDFEGDRVAARFNTEDLFQGPVDVSGWTPERLVSQLDTLVRDIRFTQPDKVGWLAKVVQRLIQHDGLPLDRLMRMRQSLARKLSARIETIRQEKRASAARAYLLDPGAPVQALSNEAFEFRAGMYDDQPSYRGPFTFSRHFLERVPAFDGKPDGEEAQCARELDSLHRQIKHWVRNVARHPASFWLQTSKDKTYPDFIAELHDGRFFVVEYKGEDHWLDAAEDRAIGEVWAKATGNVYLMARRSDGGLGPLGQMLAKLDEG